VSLVKWNRRQYFCANHFSYCFLIAAVLVALLLSFNQRYYRLDDALIYFRYIRNFLLGNGLVYNPGELVNGMTSSIYAALLVFVSSITREIEFSALLISTVAFVLAIIQLYRVVLVLVSPLVAGLSALLVALQYYFYSLYGLESGVYLLLMTTLVHNYLTENKGFFTLSAFLFLTRIEGVFLIVYLLSLKLYKRFNEGVMPLTFIRRHLTDLVCAILLVFFALGVNFFYYGSIGSTSGMAKIHQGMSGYWGDWIAFLKIHHHPAWFLNGSWFLTGFMLLTGVIGLLSKDSSPFRVVLLPALAMIFLFYFLFNIPNYHWYYAPFYFFGTVFVATGIVTLDRLSQSHRLFSTLTRGVATAGLLGLFVSAYTLTIRSGENPAYKELGVWLSQNTEPHSAVAALEIGHLGWYSERHIVDILGLITPGNSKLVAERDLTSWFQRTPADYVVIHEPGWELEMGILELEKLGWLVEVKNFEQRSLRVLKSTSSRSDF